MNRILMLLYLLVSMIPAGVSSAQGIPFLPDPITTADLNEFASMLDLSDEQHEALLPFHDQYLEAYRKLRESDIQSFQNHVLDIAAVVMRSRFQIPDRKELETVIEQFDDAQSRIAGVDRNFLGGMASVLTEEQSARLPAVERARQLDAYWFVAREISDDLSDAAEVDLSAIVRGIDLSPVERTAVDPLIAAYQQALLDDRRQLNTLLIDASGPLLDAIDAFGIRAMTPEEMMAIVADQARLTEIMNLIDEVAAPIQSKVHEMSELNLQTMRAISPNLSDDHRRAFLSEFYRDGFGMHFPGQGTWFERFEKASTSRIVPIETRDAVRAALSRYSAEDERLVERIVRLSLEISQFRPARVLIEMEQDARQEDLRALHDQRHSLDQTANASLDALLGPELVDALKTTHESDVAVAEEVRLPADSGVEREIDSPPSAVAAEGSDGGLFAPMSSSDLETFARRLEIGEEGSAVLTTLYDSYRAEFLAAAQQTESNWSPDEQSGAEAIAAIDAGMQPLLALDERLLRDLSMLTSTAHAKQLADSLLAHRERTLLNRIASRLDVGNDDGEHMVDVAEIFFSVSVGGEDTDKIVSLIAGYDQQANGMVRNRIPAAVEAHRARSLRDRMRERDANRDNPLNRAASERYREARDRLREFESNLAELNRAALADAMVHVSDALAAQIRVAYARQAWPDEFEALGSCERLFADARQLNDLQPWQSEKLHDLTGDFHADAAALVGRYVEMRRLRQREDASADRRRRRIEFEINRDRYRFDQQELLDRARLAVDLLLDDEQAARIRAGG